MKSKQQYQGFARRTRSALFAAFSVLAVSTILASGASLAATRAAAESGPELTELTVVQDGARVAVSWGAGSRADVVGFNLWREEDGVRGRVNEHIIAAGGLEGPSFHVDDTLTSPTAYVHYWVESVDSEGESSWEGPVARTFGTLAVEPAERMAYSGLED